MWEPGGGHSNLGNRDLLDRRERAWRPHLDVVSLAAEALDDIDVTERDETVVALGWLFAVQSSPRARLRLLERWPAVHVLTTAGVAADHYENGTFWPKLSARLGVRADQVFNNEWGGAFLGNLRRLGMPTFEDDGSDAGTRFVGRILMHSGIPTYCLPDFFQLMSEKRRRTAGVSPEEFVAWARGRASVGLLHNVDKPVGRFLQYGGDFATDVTSRAFDLLDSIAAGGDGQDVPLPRRFRDVALAQHAAGALAPAPRRSAAKGTSDELRPQLVIDPFERGLLLRLPPVGDAPDGSAVWLVTMDEEIQQVSTQALFPGSHEPAPQTYVPVTAPVRQASAALLGREHLRSELVVVDDNDPLLAFGDDASLLPAASPLGKAPTWFLFPGRPEDLRVVGTATVLAESPLPPGWSGWCLQLVDLADVTEVSLGATGRSRPVRDHASARVVCGNPLRGVRTSSGLPVITERPQVDLPESLAEARWEVALLDAEGDLVSRWGKDSSSSDPDSIWDAVPEPALGTFTIRVRGPWGRGAKRTFTIAEGLGVTFDPPWRRFVSPSGLQPASGVVTTPPSMDVSSKRLEFTRKVRDAYLRVGAGGVYRTLTVTPPHMSVAFQSDEATTSPSIWPQTLFSESFSEAPGILIVSLEASGEPRLHVRTASGVVQILEPGVGRAGVYRFDLSRASDTVRDHPQGELALDAEGQVVVARFRPQRLVSGVELDGTALAFTECVDVEELVVLVYLTRAPWRGAVSLPIIGGRAELPDELVGVGPLAVSVRLEDPWAPVQVPAWPDLGQYRLVEAAGWLSTGSEDEVALSAFLAGEGDLQASRPHYSRLWTIRSRLGALALGTRTEEVRTAIDSLISASPRDALLALDAPSAIGANVAAMLIESGLAQADLAAAHDDEVPRWSLATALPAALLSAADLSWDDMEVSAATEVCGDVVEELLSGNDPYATEGRLDQGADLFDKLPHMRDEFVKRCGLVPHGLLMGDTRVLAVMDFIKNRRDERLSWLVKNAHKRINESERLLRMIGDPVATAALEARCHPSATGGWRVVPAVSLGFALAARHAARGNPIAAQWLLTVRRQWTDLARVAPDLVTIDLLLSEFLVASSHSPKRRPS